ncbi:MAG: 4Fe-4S dicluster domain-containing protein [Thermoplasmata archaeon]|nr:4Fe-4S dicluster domain-containing protein [Thermoplasmata archaeon]
MKFVLDADLCTGCRACELACSFVKEGVFAPSKSRIRVVKVDEEGIDVPVGCEHCDDAPCITVCPTNALYKDDIGAVLLNDDKCIGCKQCVLVCPFGAIYYDDDKKRFYKCDLCDGEPECARWCFTGAISLEDLGKLARRRHHTKAKDFIKGQDIMRLHTGEKGDGS